MTITASGREEGLGSKTLVELLRRRAEAQAADAAFVFLRDGEHDEHRISYAELDARARAIGGALQARGLAGQRALLLYPPGIEYIAGLFGCLYAGVVPVPAYPPDPSRLARTVPRVLAIARDAEVALALTITPIRQMAGALGMQFPELGKLPFVSTDDLVDASAWQTYMPPADVLALLQYTSGSVGTPKGVMLTHANVIANEAMIRQAGHTEHDTTFVSWLPPYHDMGLFGGILHGLYLGIPSIQMSPESFLRRPLRWLLAMSKYRGSLSVAPDFAFDLCARRQATEKLEGLDLSTWRIAFNGSEPLRPQTLERFTEAFGRFGYRASTMYPCYGMAEATLIVSGGARDADPIVRRFDGAELGGMPSASRRSARRRAGRARARRLRPDDRRAADRHRQSRDLPARERGRGRRDLAVLAPTSRSATGIGRSRPRPTFTRTSPTAATARGCAPAILASSPIASCSSRGGSRTS